jgi:hypothetical protein
MSVPPDQELPGDIADGSLVVSWKNIRNPQNLWIRLLKMAEINAGGCGVRGFRLDCPIIGQYCKVIQKLDKCTYKRPS